MLIQTIAALSAAEIPDAMPVLHERCARFATAEFLRETNVYRVTLQLTVVPDNYYTLDIPWGTSAVGIRRVAIDGNHVVFTEGVPWPTVNAGRVYIPEGFEGDLELEISLTIAPLDGDMDYEIVEPWLETLTSGALARLYALPQYGWFDAKLADYHRQLYRTGIDRARSHATGRNSGRVMRVRYGGL